MVEEVLLWLLNIIYTVFQKTSYLFTELSRGVVNMGVAVVTRALFSVFCSLVMIV